MPEDRLRRAADAPPPSLARRLRAWAGLPLEPRLPRPPVARIDPVRRSWPAAFWDARLAVRAGVTLDEHLRARLAHYLASLPVSRARLPLAVGVEDGHLVVTAADPDRQEPAPAADPDAWLAPLIAAEGPSVRQEVAELEVRLAVLEGEAEGARRRTEAISRKLAADVAAGMVTAPLAVEATAEQLGRPPVRSAAAHVAALVFAGAVVAAEAWQMAVPLFRAAGLDPGRLGAELGLRPVETTFAALFALGLSAGLLALARAGLDAALSLARDELAPARRGWVGIAAAAAGAVATWVVCALGALNAPATRTPAWTYVLLLLAVPLGTALVLRVARREADLREAEAVAALAWDRERARALADRARRLEELAWAEEEEQGIARQREAAWRRLRELSGRALAASRLAAAAERRERQALARLAQSVVAALELDRSELLRQATERGATELLTPRRRRPAEPIPAPPITAVPAPAAAGDPGRLAS